MDTTALIAVAASISGILISWLTFGRTAKEQAKKDGAGAAEIKADIDYIKRGVDDIKLEQRTLRNEVTEMDKRLVIVEQSTKSAHRRIDEIRKEERADE